MGIIDEAKFKGERVIDEYASKRILSEFKIPVVEEYKVIKLEEAKNAAEKIGYPVTLKGFYSGLIHKTEQNMVALNINNKHDIEDAFMRMKSLPDGQSAQFLVQKMIYGAREIIVGLIRDSQFGPCVMLGLGGVFSEIFRDVSFRRAPLTEMDALDMMNNLRCKKIFRAIRGMSEVDKHELANILISVGKMGIEYDEIHEMDINPLIIGSNGKMIAVDASINLSYAE